MIILIAFVFGTIVGSFLNVLIWRLPREEKISGRSQCPHCHHQLNARDLVPLFSFAAARGRCRYCGKKVSPRYPLIEFITGLLFAAVAFYFLPTVATNPQVWLQAVSAALAVIVCITVFVIDLEHYLILDKIVYPSYVLFGGLIIANALLTGQPGLIFIYAISALITAVPFWAAWFFSNGKWMGFGDVKFVALMGLMLGWPGIFVALILAFVTGAVVGLNLIILGKKQLSSKLPFGTFLSAATIIALFYAQPLWDWYWGLFGV